MSTPSVFLVPGVPCQFCVVSMSLVVGISHMLIEPFLDFMSIDPVYVLMSPSLTVTVAL